MATEESSIVFISVEQSYSEELQLPQLSSCARVKARRGQDERLCGDEQGLALGKLRN